MRKVLAVAAALMMSSSAFAATIVVDDFETPQTVIDTSDDGSVEESTLDYTIDGNAFTRTLRVDQFEHNSGDPSAQSKGAIGFGEFNLSNASLTNSTIELEYDIDSLTDDFETSNQLSIDVLFADFSEQEPFTVAAFLNGELLASQTYTGPGSLNFSLPGLADSGNELRLTFNGGTAFDATVGGITILASGGQGGIPVPEPGAIGLLGLGLASVAFARRRKAAA